MKKILIFLIFLTLILLCNYKEEVYPAFNYDDDEILIVNIIITNLNTNNFYDYFDENIDIIGIYPKVNSLYKNKIGTMFYSFSQNNIKSNITSFIKYYKKVLKKNNFTNDLILIDYNGVYIEKVKVCINYKELLYFLGNCSNCIYEKIS